MTSTKATPLNRRQATSDAAESSDTCVKSHWKHGLALSVLTLFLLTTQSASAMHPAFQNAGKSPGLEIWRIENFTAVPYPRNEYGKFYTGDSYIVLVTKQHGTWDIHFWLGNQTSQDEAGAAAMLAVDLDDSLGGVPVQYREVQDHESSLFRSHFPAGVRYLSGGVASGFHHVDPDAVEKRLFQVKGKRNIRVRQVALDVSSMNQGDCFILDAGREVFVYSGQNSKRTERLKAIAAANQIRDQDHAGRARVIIIDENASEDERTHFFTELGSGSPSAISPESAGGDDLEFERQTDNNVTLYKITDASGSMVVQKIAEKPLHQNMLLTAGDNEQDCFILDTITSGLYVWIGRASTKNEKLEAMRKAEQFLAQNNYPQWTRVQRVVQDAETSYFKQYFSGWREAGDTMGMGRLGIAASVPERSASPTRSPFRGKRMAKSGGCAMGFMPDDGQSGEVEIWSVKDFELVPVPENSKGFFFGGDCYIIKYTYQNDGRRGYVIYFWLGNESTNDERAAAAIHTVRLDNEISGKAVQVRVRQGNEPRHFLRIFKGKLIILMGGHASGFRNINDHDSFDVDGTRLFRVRGTCPDDTRAVQVPEVAASLNSDDAYVLETPTSTYIWQGQGCSDDEKEMAVNASALVSPGRDPIVVLEGEEPEEFWESLGGQGEYPREFSGKDIPHLEPKLFHCYFDSRGHTVMEDIGYFRQTDLNEDDLMLLDVGDEIYVWIGGKASPEEKEGAVKVAEDYLKNDPTERSPNTTLIITLKQGEESENFISYFPAWDSTSFESRPSYDDIKRLLKKMNARFAD